MTANNNKTMTMILGAVGAVIVVALVAVLLMRGGGEQPEPRPVVRGNDRPAANRVVEPERELLPERETKPRPTPAPAVVEGKTELAVVVVDEANNQPLEGARVEVLSGEEVVHDLKTDKTGSVLVEEPAVGDYMLRVRWSTGAPIPSGPVTVVADQRVTHLVKYTARERFRFRLVDTKGVGMPGVKLSIAFPTFEGSNLMGDFTETYTTDSQGYFEILNYTDLGRRLKIGAEADMLLRRRGEKSWLNPMTYMPPLNAERYPEPVLEGTRDVVTVSGRLVNPPPLPEGQQWQVDASAGPNTQRFIPVVDNEFSFRAGPGEKYVVDLYRPGAQAPPASDRSSAAELQRLLGRNKEMSKQLELPAEPGPFTFEFEFADRLEVKGRVVDEEGRGVEGIAVRARGFVAPKGDPPGGVRVGFGDTDTSSAPSGSDGSFSIALAPAAEYTFLPQTLDPMQAMKGVNSVTKKWDELKTGDEVILEVRNPALAWGEVVDEMGQPVARASVRLRGPELPPGYARFASASDADGLFQLDLPTIPGLNPGESTEATGSMFIEATKQGYGRGLGPVVVDSPDRPVRIVVYKEVQVMINATNGSAPVDQLNISYVYDVPEFSAPFYSGKTVTMDGNAGQYLLFNVPRQITTLSLSLPDDTNMENVREFRIPLETELRHEINVDFGKKQ